MSFLGPRGPLRVSLIPVRPSVRQRRQRQQRQWKQRHNNKDNDKEDIDNEDNNNKVIEDNKTLGIHLDAYPDQLTTLGVHLDAYPDQPRKK